MPKTLPRIGPDLDALKTWAGVPEGAPLHPVVLKHSVMRAAKASMREPIVWGIPTRGTISSRWLQGFYMQYRHPDDVVWCVEGTLVDANRNMLIESFLQSDYQWLLQWDDDVVFTESASDVIARMMRVGQEHGARVISGMYVQKRDPFYPHIYRDVTETLESRPDFLDLAERALADDSMTIDQKMSRVAELGRLYHKRSYLPILDFVPNTVVEADAVGGGCLLVHRSIYERLAAILEPGWAPGMKSPQGDRIDPPPWFTFRYGFGEDMSFCYHVRTLLNEPIMVDTSIKLSHLATEGLTFDHFVANQLAMAETENTQAAIDGVKERMGERSNGTATTDVLTELFHQGVEDWKRWAKLDDAAVEWYFANATELVAEGWRDRKPKTAAEMDEFYATINYIPDLLLWNNTPAFAGRVRAPLSYNKKNVADFGGGVGTLALLFARQGCHVYHVDVPGFTRDFATTRFVRANANVSVVSDLEGITDLDLITAIDTLEHIHPDAIERIARQMADALRPGGRVYHHSSFLEIGERSDTHPMHLATEAKWEQAFVDAGLSRFDNRTWVKP